MQTKCKSKKIYFKPSKKPKTPIQIFYELNKQKPTKTLMQNLANL